MRVVNMAHGSFYLLGGYIAYEIQQKMNPESQGFSTQPFQTSTWEWVLPLLVTVGCIARLRPGVCSSFCCAGTRVRTCGRR